MAHPKCDRCQNEVDLAREIHYCITIEIEAGGFVDAREVDEPLDAIDRLDGLLDDADELCEADFEDAWFQSKQYVLCQCCYQEYIKNPLARSNS